MSENNFTGGKPALILSGIIFLIIFCSYFFYNRGVQGIATSLLMLCVFLAFGLIFRFLPRSNDSQRVRVIRYSLIEAALFVCVLSVLAVCALLAGPYRVLGTSFITGAGHAILQILSIYVIYIVFTLAQYMLGVKALSFFWFSKDHDEHTMLFAFGIGLFVTALFFYLAALLRMLRLEVLLVYLLMVLIAGRGYYKQLWQLITTRLYSVPIKVNLSDLGFQKSVVILSGVVFVIMLIASLGGYYPLGADDIRTYYTVPKTFVEQGGIVIFPHDVLNQSTAAFAYLYIPFIEFLPAYINFIGLYFFIGCIWLLWSLGKRYFGERVALLSVFFFITIPWNFWFLYTVKPDFLTTFITVLALLAILKYNTQPTTSYLALGGLLLGFAGAIKYSAFLFAPAMCIVLWSAVRKEGWLQWIRAVGIFLICVTLAYAPWGVRSFVLWGNPFHPFSIVGENAAYVFSSDAARNFYDRLYEASYSRAHALQGANPWWKNVLYLLASKSSYSGNQIGPLFFGMLPLLFFIRPKRDDSRLLAGTIAFVGVSLATWFLISVSQVWYAMSAFALWCVIVGYYFFRTPSKFFQTMIIICCLLVFAFRSDFSRLFMVRFYSGMLTERQYLQPFGGSVSLADFMNEQVLPAHHEYVVFPMGQQRPILFQDSYRHVYGNNFFMTTWSAIAADTRTTDEARERLRSLGITHVFYIPADIAFDRALWCAQREESDGCRRITYVLRRFDELAKQLTLVRQTPEWSVYQL